MSEQRKVAVITGASQGIGAAVAEAYLSRGYRVVATSRSIAASDNPDVLAIQGDIGDPETARKIIGLAPADHGPNHVGIGAFNLVRAAAYRAAGGHQAIAMRPEESS